ncbi:MAG: DinB family protein [Chloroflexota bacterium]
MTDERAEAVKAKLATVRADWLAMVGSMSDSDWDQPAFAEDSEWRMIDAFRHIVDSEKGMTGLIIQIKAGGEGVPPDFDIDRWNQRVVTKLKDKTAADLFSEMDANRRTLLGVIESLEPEDWDKQGRHGSLQIMSIEEICYLIADHEQAHMESMKAVLAE